MSLRFSMFTQYGQFYIADEGIYGDTGSQEFWNSAALNERLAIEDGILGVSIENDESIANGEIILLDSRIEEDFTEFDHVVEGSLLVKSGSLRILDCPNFQTEAKIDLEPGWYRVRIYSSNLNKAYKEKPEDTYLIKIWRESLSQRNVLKQWHRS